MEPQHIVRSGTEHCRECRSGIVGGSIPYCNGYWGSMSRALGCKRRTSCANWALSGQESGFVIPTIGKGGDLEADRDAAMGKDMKCHLRESQTQSQQRGMSCHQTSDLFQVRCHLTIVPSVLKT